MEEGFLQGLLSSTDGSGHDRTNAYAKLYNILCPPQPNLREIAQGFALSEKTSGAEVWESLLDGPGDPIGQAAKKDGGSLEGDSCRGAPQRSSEPLRTVTGFEASSSGSDGGRTGEAQAGKNGPDSSELSIGLLRRKKVQVWLLAKTLSEDEATEAIEFNVDADRSLTAGMLVQVILGKVSSKTYDVDPAAYEVRFPDIPSDDEAGGGDSDGEGASPEPPTIRGDATLPPLGPQQPVFQANSKTLVIQARAKPTVGLKMKTRVSIASFERDRSRFPTLAQLSPEELDEYFEKHDLKESSRGHITCVVRLAISPLCAAKLVGGSGRDAQQLSGCIPQSILVRAGSRLTVEGLVKIFLSSLSKGLESTWRDWMVRKTGSSSLDTIDNGRSEFWMHQGGAQLGDVLDADARVSDTVPWQTVVLLPRTSKYSLETKHDKQGEEGRSASKPKVTYLFTEQTATMYVEYAVVKVNRYGKRQERVLGIDREQIYNLLPRVQLEEEDPDDPARSEEEPLSAGELLAAKSLRGEDGSKSLAAKMSRGLLQSSTSETKKRVRRVAQVKECGVSEESHAIARLCYQDGSTYKFEFESADKCAEAVARINYLVNLCREAGASSATSASVGR